MIDISQLDARQLVENLASGVAVHGPDTKLIYANQVALKLLAQPEAGAPGISAEGAVWTFVDGFRKPLPERSNPVNRVIRSGKRVAPYELGILDKHSGRITWLICSAYPQFDSEGRLKQVIVTLVDITDNLKWLLGDEAADQTPLSSQALLQWQERFELAIRAANDGIWDWDLLSEKLCFSARWKGMLGYSPEEIDDEFDEWTSRVHPDDLQGALDAAERYVKGEAPACTVELRMMHKDGEYRHILARAHLVRDKDGRPARLVGTNTDITARKHAEELLKERNRQLEDTNEKLKQAHAMLLQQEKMASIGQLAAGVAHEINNPMGYIQSNIATLESYFLGLTAVIDTYEAAESHVQDAAALAKIAKVKQVHELDYLREDVIELISETKGGVERIVKIVNDLKGFSHLGSDEWELADIVSGIDKTLSIVQNELKYKAVIVKEFEAMPEIKCLPSQLNQVILNLLVNAGHAIQKDGRITIRTGRLGESEVYLEIEDNGHGIPKDKLVKIFDPFFTTKPVGKGTGLGLSIAYGIVEKHKGKITVDSEEGRGTRFRIVLPVAGGEDEAANR